MCFQAAFLFAIKWSNETSIEFSDRKKEISVKKPEESTSYMIKNGPLNVLYTQSNILCITVTSSVQSSFPRNNQVCKFCRIHSEEWRHLRNCFHFTMPHILLRSQLGICVKSFAHSIFCNWVAELRWLETLLKLSHVWRKDSCTTFI